MASSTSTWAQVLAAAQFNAGFDALFRGWPTWECPIIFESRSLVQGYLGE